MKEVPLLGTGGAKLIHVGKYLHNVPNDIAMAAVRDQLDSQFPQGWWACVLLSDGRGTLCPDGKTRNSPGLAQQDRIVSVCLMLNKDLHHDGHWIGAWSNHRFSILFRDRDGDLQFTIEFDEPWERLTRWTDQEFVDRAETGYVTYADQISRVNLKPEHLFKQAQGELPTRH